MQAIDVTHTQPTKRIDVSRNGVLHQQRPTPKDCGKGYGAPAKPTAARVTERPEILAGVRARGDARKALLYKDYKAAGKPYFSRVSGPCPGNPRPIRASGSF